MEEYLNKSIKEVITEFPEVSKILEAYDIGCGPCLVGTCLLKDIVNIHHLPADQEAQMMARVARVIHPDQSIAIPEVKIEGGTKPKEFKFTPPMKTLVDEHVLIKRFLALIPEVLKDLDLDSDEGRKLILQGVDFIRSYADRYHHAKEEDILFKYFDDNLDILKVMFQDHTQGRAHVKAIVDGVERKDKAAVAEHLQAYRELLSGHIKKEDEILYPWMERNLSITQIGELYSKFQETDQQLGYSPARFEHFIDNLEEKLLRVSQ
jgi:hemerythrin-like domain-containing protein